MSARLDKERSRERMRQLRVLWNEWDPIGVISDSDGLDDEYSGYAGKSMRYLEADDEKGLVEYLRWAVFENMGLSREPDPSFEEFAKRLRQWFQSNWAGTHV